MAEQQYPEPTAGALIFNKEGKLLLMKSHKWQNKYVIPGGHIETGETIQDALKREIKEETGLDIYDIEYLAFHEFIFDETFWKKKHFILFNFACKTDQTKVILNSEAQECEWATLEETKQMPIEKFTKKTIEQYIQKKKQS